MSEFAHILKTETHSSLFTKNLYLFSKHKFLMHFLISSILKLLLTPCICKHKLSSAIKIFVFNRYFKLCIFLFESKIILFILILFSIFGTFLGIKDLPSYKVIRKTFEHSHNQQPNTLYCFSFTMQHFLFNNY